MPAPPGPEHHLLDRNSVGHYWLATPKGRVELRPRAALGSAASLPLNHPIVGITDTQDQQGYWLVASDGGVFSYGERLLRFDRFHSREQAHRGPHTDARRARATGESPPTGASSPTGTPPSTAPPLHRAEQADRGMTPPRRQGLLDGRLRRGHLLLRGRRLYGFTVPSLSPAIVGMAPRRPARATGWWRRRRIFNYGDAAFAGSAAGDPASTRPKGCPDRFGDGYWVEEQNGTGVPLRRRRRRAPDRGAAVHAGPPRGQGRPLRLRPARQASHLGWQRAGRLRLLGPGVGRLESVGVGFARVSDDQYHTAGQPVALNSLSAGDLVFWGTSQTDGPPCTTPRSTSAGPDRRGRPATTVQLTRSASGARAISCPTGAVRSHGPTAEDRVSER